GLLPELPIRCPVLLRADDERLAVAVLLHDAPQILADRLAEQRYGAGTVRVRRNSHRCLHTSSSEDARRRHRAEPYRAAPCLSTEDSSPSTVCRNGGVAVS